MYGLSFASKKSLPFSLPSFRPLPVFTLFASTLMSSTPVVTSLDANFSVASHFSNTPSIGTDAFTLNVILNPPAGGVTTNTGTSGACALTGNAATIDAPKIKAPSRITIAPRRAQRARIDFDSTRHHAVTQNILQRGNRFSSVPRSDHLHMPLDQRVRPQPRLIPHQNPRSLSRHQHPESVHVAHAPEQVENRLDIVRVRGGQVVHSLLHQLRPR